MANLLNAWVDGIVGEIGFFIVAAIIMLPFVIVDFVISRKISRLKPEEDSKILKKFNTIKGIASSAAAIAVAVIIGCIMQFAFKIDVLEDDLSSLVILVSALSVLPLTMCIFDLVRYFKLKKLYFLDNKKRDESKDDNIWL